MLGLTERPHYPHDRYSIIDGVLWAIAATAVLSFYVQRRKSSTPILVSGALLVAVLAGLSWRQTARWHSDLPFFTAMSAQLRSPHYRSQALPS